MSSAISALSISGEFLISFDLPNEMLTFEPSLDDLLNITLINASSRKTRESLQCSGTQFRLILLVRPFLLFDVI